MELPNSHHLHSHGRHFATGAARILRLLAEPPVELPGDCRALVFREASAALGQNIGILGNVGEDALLQVDAGVC